MDQILFNEEQSIEAFKRTITPGFRSGLDVAVARYRNGELMGGVVFTDYYHEHSITIHAHSWQPNWLNRDMLFVIFDYPFKQLGVKYLFATAREDNSAFELHIGFKIVASIEYFYPDAARLILRMDRDDCRYLDVKPRRIRPALH